MPRAEFFRHLGLFVLPEFISETACRELIALIDAAPKRRGRTNAGGGKSQLDELHRSVDDAKVPKAATQDLLRSFLGLRSDLENHFKMPLEWGGEGPDYLLCHVGDFFKRHRDDQEYPPAPDSVVIRRRVALILFLSRYSREPHEDCFGGGLLNFYGLLDGPEWKGCALGLEGEPGLLVAFPASQVHEVTLVTFGKRYTVLTGFHAPRASGEPSAR